MGGQSSQICLAEVSAHLKEKELAVVVAALAQRRPALATGNIIGSCISNILGAFSLGLLFYKPGTDDAQYVRSSKLYVAALASITIPAVVLMLVSQHVHINVLALGVCLVVIFALYILAILWAIRRGLMAAPEDSDDENDENDSSDSDGSDTDERRALLNSEPVTAPRTGRRNSSSTEPPFEAKKPKNSLVYHILFLLVGLLALLLSAYTLSHASIGLINALGLADDFFGVVILALATTLPEKFIAVMTGFRGQPGIMMATTVGSNIFLLTLCLGILCISAGQAAFIGHGWRVDEIKVGVMLGATALLALSVWARSWSRVIGVVMLLAYVAFIAVEFAISARPGAKDPWV